MSLFPRTFRLLLYFFPKDFRRTYAGDLLTTVEERRLEIADHGRWSIWRFWVRESLALAREGLRVRRRRGGPASVQRGAIHRAVWKQLASGVFADVRHSVRRLLAAPWFSVAAVLILGMGIGGNSAMFSVLRDAILAGPPYPDPEQLVLPAISHVYPTYTYHGASYPEYEMLRDVPDRMVEPLAGYALVQVTLAGLGDAERLNAEVVTPDYFRLLGASAALGRTFAAADGDKEAPSLVVVIDDGFWSSRFGRDPDVLGREMFVNGNAVAVVGVMPRSFRGVTGRGHIWLPMAAAGVLMDQWRVSNHGAHWFSLLGRLRSGVSSEVAESQFLSVASEIRSRWPDHGAGGDLVPTVRLFRTVATNETAETSLLLLAAAAALVLLIICANLAGLLLARASARTRETAIRLAIGAGRWRVARQCLIECLLVGLAGGVVGLAAAFWGVETLAFFAPEAWIGGSNDLQFVNLEQSGIDWGVTLFALGLAFGTSLLFGILPAVRISDPEKVEELRAPAAAAAGGTRRRTDTRSLLVSGQVALALVLLVAAGLMIMSLSELQRVESGVEESNLLTFSYKLPRSAESTSPHFSLRDADAAEVMAFQGRFLERLRTVPGVNIATSGCPPLGGLCASSQVRGIEGRPDIPESEWLQVGTLIVEDSYFEAVGARILEGRSFSPTDWRESSQVLILNESAVSDIFPGQSALGQRISLGHSVMPEGSMAEVVGVVSDIRYASPEVGVRPVVYLSARQVPVENPTFIVRTANDPFSVLPAIRAEMRSLSPGVPIHHVSTVEELGDLAMGSTRLVMSVLSVFATFATILAVVGVYAVIAYSVAQRSREIGIRVAIGAPPAGVLGLVLRQGVLTAGAGVMVGLAVAWGLARMLSSLLFGVSPSDPLSFGLAALLLFVATLLASYVPARRVTRIDPIEVLRTE